MFWADSIAEELRKRKLPLEWVDDMKTPSGRIHVGALRGVVVHDLVYKALKDLGVNTKYTYVFEDHDPMDDIPSYLPREKYEKYLGLPLFKIPSLSPDLPIMQSFMHRNLKKLFGQLAANPKLSGQKICIQAGK
jgi:lysyl-tRNA synthetase class 1